MTAQGLVFGPRLAARSDMNDTTRSATHGQVLVDGRFCRSVAPGDSLRVGRHSSNDIVIDAPRVSRFHAVICWDVGCSRPVVRDLASANGSILDGRPFDGEHPLRSGSTVDVGGARLVVNFEGEPVGATSSPTDGQGSTPITSIERDFDEARPLSQLVTTLEAEAFTGTLDALLPAGVVSVTLVDGVVMAARSGDSAGFDAIDVLRAAASGRVVSGSTLACEGRPMNLRLSAYLNAPRDRPITTRRGRPATSQVVAVSFRRPG